MGGVRVLRGTGIAINGANVISNSGLLSLTGSGAVQVSAGQSPTVSLGVVPIANGGTGLDHRAWRRQPVPPQRRGGRKWKAGAIQPGDLPAGNGSYIQNSTSLQAGASFHIDGSGTLALLTVSGVARVGGDPDGALYSRGIAFVRDAGDDVNAGKIAYRPTDSNALDIYGAGATGVRKTRLWDNVEVMNSLLVDGPISGSGSGLTNLNASQLTTGTVPGAALSGSYNISVTGSAGSFTGSLGGDVTGTQANTSLAKIRTVPLSTAGLTANHVLRFSGTQWEPSSDVISLAGGPGITVSAPSGAVTVSIGGGAISNSMLVSASIGVTAGAGLSGGGSAPLGGSTTLAANLVHDTTLNGNGGSAALGLNLGNANTWSGAQTFNAATRAYGSLITSTTNTTLGSDQGGHLELGANNATANSAGATPYIDLHYGTGAAQDYNLRLVNDANARLSVVSATGTAALAVTGTVSATSSFTGGSYCVGTDCRTSWNNQDAGAVNPMPRTCPVGQIAVSTGAYKWTCAVNCSYGSADCDSNPNNACESNIATGPTTCGACGVVCPYDAQFPSSIPFNPHITTPACSSGNCSGNCDTGFADCNSNKLSDGCEVNIFTTATSCGACGTVCPYDAQFPGTIAFNPHITTPTCGGTGQCTGACDGGWADCNTNKLSDGCETDIATNVLACGACGVVCSIQNVARACSGGSCQAGTCNTNFADCNSNKQLDGCEINTSNNTSHCGVCNNACTLTSNASATTCTSSACRITGCSANFYDVNSTYSDGCECNATGVNNGCGGEAVGSIGVNSTINKTNVLPGGSGEHWYNVTFVNSGNTYAPKVVLTGTGYRMDLYADCSGTQVTQFGQATGCSEGTATTGLTTWETSNTGGLTPGFPNPAPSVSMYVRVRAVSNTACTGYTISFRNNQ